MNHRLLDNTAIALCQADPSAGSGLIERAVCFAELSVAGGVPEWVQLMPAGTFSARDGREAWSNGTPEKVVAASLYGNVQMVVDYEHQTLKAEDNGAPAPAAGWIKELAVRDGAIWGRVEWTERAKAMIAAREYRYLSPVFYHDKTTRGVTRIESAALTNIPALDIKALAKARSENGMEKILEQIRTLLGLKADADGVAICKAIGELKSNPSLKAIAKAAKLGEDATGEQIVKAIETLKSGSASLVAIAKAAKLPETASTGDVVAAVAKAMTGGSGIDETRFVPMEQHNKVATDFAKLQDEIRTDKANEFADAAVEAGKVVPAQRDWAVAYAKRDAAGFKEFIDKQPVIVAPGTRNDKKPGKPADRELDESELAICRLTGADPKKFKEARAKIEAEPDRTWENRA